MDALWAKASTLGEEVRCQLAAAVRPVCHAHISKHKLLVWNEHVSHPSNAGTNSAAAVQQQVMRHVAQLSCATSTLQQHFGSMTVLVLS
jgi:hypothetical protein